jgi:hypothetical protein
MTVAPQITGTLLLAVHAPETGCKFNIWTCATADPAQEAERPAIAAVNKLMKKFNILSQYDPKELEVHFPR